MNRSSSKALGVAKNTLKEIGIIIFGLTAILALIAVYILSSPVFLFRILVNKLAKFLRPDLISMVSPQGNLFSADLLSSKPPRCAIVVPVVLQGNFANNKSEFHTRFKNMVNAKEKETGKDLYPEYKQYVENWMGFSFWKNDPHFDLKNHVKFYTSRNANITTQEEFCEVVEELLNKRFESGRSPWEAHILNNYDDGTKTAILLRFHHSLADGYSLLYSLIEGLLQVPMSSISLPTPTYAKHDTLGMLTFPIRLIRDIALYFIKGIRRNPFNVPDNKKAWHQFYGRGKPVSIEKIKEIKNALGVTFTSVLLAAVSSSLSTVTREKVPKRGEAIEKAAFFIPLPMPGHGNGLSNHVTGAQIDLPMTYFRDRTLRVRECDMLLGQQKASTIPWLLQFLAKTLGLHFSAVCGILSANRVNVAGLTSFPVSPNELTLGFQDGKILSVELVAGSLIGITGAAIMAISYGKNIYFSATAERSVLTKRDVDRMLALLCDEIAVLHETVCK